MRNVNMSLPKVSVIVPVYNTERFVLRCIKSILSQTYENLEIILVNDASTDASLKILEDAAARDKRIRVVRHPKNMGLFLARLTGVKKSTGEYIAFVDSDDHISEDFLRRLVHRAVSGGYDIVMGDTVHEDSRGERWMHASYNGMRVPDRFGDDVLSEYLKQEGYLFLWHAVWNKLYKRRLFDLGMPFFESVDRHLIMGEDILYSTVLHYYARSFSRVDLACYFYTQHRWASTAPPDSVSRFSKYLSDISEVFSEVFRFFADKRITDESLSHLYEWRALYSRFWCDNIKNSSLAVMDKRRMLKKLCRLFGLSVAEGTRGCDNWFYSQRIPFDNRYLDLVSKIRKYDTVSFDLFDTVLVRKCYRPTDVFYFLDSRLGSIFKKRGVFHDVRTLAERTLRASSSREITLREIYDYIGREYGLDETVTTELFWAEVECEAELLDVRHSVINLIEMARHLGKEVIITSDFYMGRDVLEKILAKKGVQYDKLIVSADFRKTKSDGALFGVLRREASSSRILHIGDNWRSDYEMCRDMGIDAHFYPSTVACFMNQITDVASTPSSNVYTEPFGQWISYEHSLEFLEVRCAVALAANRLYDNPYISYLRGSAFNSSAAFMGYYALGMHLFGVARWLYESNLDRGGRLHFIARDGYLPRLAYDLLNAEGRASRSNYLYSSRKALLPLLYLQSENVCDFIPHVKGAGKEQLDRWLSPILLPDKNARDKTGEKRLSDIEMYRYIKYSLQNRLSKERSEAYIRRMYDYFSGVISDEDAFFDIGYSGRPIVAFSALLDKRLSAFFIHRTSDRYATLQRKMGIRIDCFYDYTPAVTGSVREMLFSSQEPSCIGYSEGSAFCPVFEEQNLSFVERFAIDEVQREALAFVADMKKLYFMSPELFSARPMDLSAPYEYLLSCCAESDLCYFGAVRFEDEVYHAKRDMMLCDVWRGSKDYHRVSDRFAAFRPKYGDGLDRSVGELILPRSRTMRALFYLLFDRPVFLKKLKKRFFSGDTK